MKTMRDSPLLVCDPDEIVRIAQPLHTPEEIRAALWDYAFIAWQRGQRFERARAADASARIWDVRPLGAR